MKKLSWFNKVVYGFNIILIVLTILAYVLPFLAPKAFPLLSVLTLILPLFLILNALFFIYWLLQLKRQLILSGIILLLGITFINKFYKFSSNEVAKEEKDFTLMSYNVRLFNLYKWLPKNDVPEQISKLIADEKADILCIQEFSPNDKIETAQFKYNYTKLYGGKNKYGQAIYSNYKIIDKGEIEFPNSSNNVIFADIVKGEDTLRVYSMHLQSIKISTDIHERMDEEKSKFIFKRISGAFTVQQHQAELIKAHYQSCTYAKIICGDLNNSAFSYVYRTIKGDMKDAFEEAGTSFGKSYNFKYYPARIDYIFVESTIKVKQFKSISTFFQSDHFPQIARLSITSKSK